MTTTARTYALRDGTYWWYYIVPPRAAGWFLNNVTRVTDPFGNDLTPGQVAGWYRSQDPCSSVLIHREKRGDVARYRLDDAWRGRPEVDLPDTLDPDEYARRALTGEDHDDLDPAGLPAIYRAAYVAERDDPYIETTEVPMDGVTVLDGAPPDAVPAGATWRSTLPVELRERHEYRHLFPGRLDGFRGAVAAELGRIHGVSAYDHSDFTVYARSGGRTGELVRDGVIDPPPGSIGGENLAEAAAAWNEALAGYVKKVRRYLIDGDCWRCRGTGTIPNGGDEDRDRLVQTVAERFVAEAGRSRAVKDRARDLAEVAVRMLGPAAGDGDSGG